MPIQTVAVVFAVMPVVVLAVFGLAALWFRSTLVATACEVIAHAGVGIGGIFYMYFIVPRFKRILEDFGTELDTSTKMLISISDMIVNYWYMLLPLWVAGMVLDAVAFATFHRVPESRYVARTFSALVTVGLLCAAVFVGVALDWGQSGLLQKLQ
jgi:hypothetical protein